MGQSKKVMIVIVFLCVLFVSLVFAPSLTFSYLPNESGNKGQLNEWSSVQGNASGLMHHTSSQEDVKLNSVGGYVWELQGRLKYLGFYDGEIDGHFGGVTDRAVRDFQNEFGLKVDGIVGDKTKEKLWRATKNWKGLKQQEGQQLAREGVKQQAGKQRKVESLRPGNREAQKPQGGGGPTPTGQRAKDPVTVTGNIQGFSQNDVRLMANAVYGEARGEPYVGQVAIAAVILNRVNSPLFPNTPGGVIYEPRAFTAVADGQINLTPNETAKKAVEDAINGWDPTGGAIYYFNPDTATSPWIWSRPQIKKIGKHIFSM